MALAATHVNLKLAPIWRIGSPAIQSAGCLVARANSGRSCQASPIGAAKNAPAFSDNEQKVDEKLTQEEFAKHPGEIPKWG